MVVDVDRQAVSIVQDTTPHIVGTRHSLSRRFAFSQARRSHSAEVAIFHCPHHHYGGTMDPITRLGFISNKEALC